jgi:hypothetical protein
MISDYYFLLLFVWEWFYAEWENIDFGNKIIIYFPKR